jgi:hypothetical protein
MKNNKTKLESLILEEFELYKKEKELLNEIKTPFQVVRGIRNFLSSGRTSLGLLRYGMSELNERTLNQIIANSGRSGLTKEKLLNEVAEWLKNNVTNRQFFSTEAIEKLANIYKEGIFKGGIGTLKNRAGSMFKETDIDKATVQLTMTANELINAIKILKQVTSEHGKFYGNVAKKIENMPAASRPPGEIYEVLTMLQNPFISGSKELNKLLPLLDMKTEAGRTNIFKLFLQLAPIDPALKRPGLVKSIKPSLKDQNQRIVQLRNSFVGKKPAKTPKPDDARAPGAKPGPVMRGGRGLLKLLKVLYAKPFPYLLFGVWLPTVLYDYYNDLKNNPRLLDDLAREIMENAKWWREIPMIGPLAGPVAEYTLKYFLGIKFKWIKELADDLAGGYANPEGLSGHMAHKRMQTTSEMYNKSVEIWSKMYLSDIARYTLRAKEINKKNIEQIKEQTLGRISSDLSLTMHSARNNWNNQLDRQHGNKSRISGGDWKVINDKWDALLRGLKDGPDKSIKYFSSDYIYNFYKRQAGVDSDDVFLEAARKEWKEIREKEPKLEEFEERVIASRLNMIHNEVSSRWEKAAVISKQYDIPGSDVRLEDFQIPFKEIGDHKKGQLPSKLREKLVTKGKKISEIINSFLVPLGFNATDYENIGIGKLVDQEGSFVPKPGEPQEEENDQGEMVTFEDRFYTLINVDDVKGRQKLRNQIMEMNLKRLSSEEFIDELYDKDLQDTGLTREDVVYILKYVQILIPYAMGTGFGLVKHGGGKEAKKRTRSVMKKQEEQIEKLYVSFFKAADEEIDEKLIKQKISEASQDLGKFAIEVRKIYQKTADEFKMNWEP